MTTTIVQEAVREAENSIQFSLDPQHLPFSMNAVRPGHFVTIRKLGANSTQGRSYSVASGIGDDKVTFGIRASGRAGVSTSLVEEIRSGYKLEVSNLLGNVLATDYEIQNAREVLAICAGSGITPAMSLMKSVFKSNPYANITLLYINRSPQTVMFLDALCSLKDIYNSRFSILNRFTRTGYDDGKDIRQGRITEPAIQALVKACVHPEALPDIAVTCCPPALHSPFETELLAAGIPASAVRTEGFGGSTLTVKDEKDASRAESGSEVVVTVLHGGIQYIVPVDPNGETLLQAALRAGVVLPHSCRTGVCKTCRAVVTHSEEDYHTTHQGVDVVLACQYRPTASCTVSCDDALGIRQSLA
ncbi:MULTISPECIES: 2Fe-2S iron-sulfur cluster-binding protein [Acetobacteraceae]|nr:MULTISPECIES: 2Fe-2S iron-sulfur cluster-binding protein [Acetobacteraceae]